MTMNITSKQMEITPAIRQHVADRLAKLDKWQTHLINPHIIPLLIVRLRYLFL